MFTKEQRRVYMRNRRKRLRNELLELLGGKCTECSATQNLEFNHIIPKDKLFTLSGKAFDRPSNVVLAEGRKCEVLCVACHGKRTSTQWATGEIQSWNKGLVGVFDHGTASSYNQSGCRCDLCKEAKRQSRR